MHGSHHISEGLALVATIDPVSQAAATVLTDAVDMSKFDRVIFIISIGAMSATSVVNFSIKDSATSGGTYAALSPAKAITALTAAGTDDNKQVIIEVKAEEMNADARFLKGEMVVTVAASLVSVIVLAGEPRFTPVTDDDLASVDEVVRGG